MTIEEYTIDEHIHRFAVWTSARAASRSRLKNSETEYLIDHSRLREEINTLKEKPDLSEKVFREWFQSKGEEIVSIAKDKNWSDFKTTTFKFGLAAKIISIYIKTVEVIPSRGLSKLSQIAHPPIDGILLRNLGYGKADTFKTNWSTFGWAEYEKVINRIQIDFPGCPGWKIEHAWKVSPKEDVD